MSFAEKVVILSDDYLFCKGVQSFLSGKEDRVIIHTAATFSAFESQARVLVPDLIILDLTTKAFKVEKVIAYVSFTTQSKIWLMGECCSKNDCEQMRQWGSHAISLKSTSEEELVATYLAIQTKQFHLAKGVVVEAETHKSDLLIQLNISEREKEIIKLIAEGFINKEIADKLFLSTHTVNTHRKNIMQKLGINNTAGIVLFAVKENIVSPSEFLFH